MPVQPPDVEVARVAGRQHRVVTPRRTLIDLADVLSSAASAPQSAAGSCPVPEMNQEVLGWEVDAYRPEHRLAVELDHPHTHLDARAFETDRLRLSRWLAAGPP